MPIIIYQDIQQMHISKVEESDFLPNQPFQIDCDEDSILVKGVYPVCNLLRLDSSNLTTNQLVPVITQDQEGLVLMQAFLNMESLNLSFQSGFAHYFSRSRNKLWKKGEESGHLQTIISISYNNEFNFYIYQVKQISNACHTGAYTCFYRKVENGISSLK